MEKVTLSGTFQTQPRRRRSGTTKNTKLSITRSFFELETPDFAWKFVWTVRTKYTHKKYKVLITQPFFELQILHESSYGLSD